MPTTHGETPVLIYSEEPDGTTRYVGTLHEAPIDLRIEPDPEHPPLWRWARLGDGRVRVQQTCVTRGEAIRQAFDWLKALRDD